MRVPDRVTDDGETSGRGTEAIRYVGIRSQPTTRPGEQVTTGVGLPLGSIVAATKRGNNSDRDSTRSGTRKVDQAGRGSVGLVATTTKLSW